MLTEEQISRFLDGEDDGSVAERVEADPEAAAQVAAARRREAALHRHLHRWDCPTTQQLTDYALALLPGPERPAIDRHLDYCLRCREELDELARFLADEPPPAESRRIYERRAPGFLLPEVRLEPAERAHPQVGDV